MAETMDNSLAPAGDSAEQQLVERWPWTDGADRRLLSRLVRRLEDRLLCAETALWDEWHREVYELRTRVDDPAVAIDGSAARLAEIASQLELHRPGT